MNERIGRGGPRRRHGGPPEDRRDRGGRMRRGDIRTALLAVLAEAPGHGYELIQTIESKTDGAWRPSPGSVYPTLQMLEDEGLVRSTERDGKRIFELTEAGRAEATTRVEEAGGAPWDHMGRGGRRPGELREAMLQLHLAIKQLAMSGNADLTERAAVILRDTRKQLYQLLAES